MTDDEAWRAYNDMTRDPLGRISAARVLDDNALAEGQISRDDWQANRGQLARWETTVRARRALDGGND